MRISARQTLPASAWTRSQSAGSLSPRATFSACGTCTSGTLKTEWMMGNRSDPPCHRECSCYCGIEVPFLGLAQRSLKPRDDVDTALIPCLQRVKSLRWTRRSFFVGRSKIPTLPDRPCLCLSDRANQSCWTRIQADQIPASILSVYWLHTSGVYVGSSPRKNHRFILDHLESFLVLYRAT